MRYLLIWFAAVAVFACVSRPPDRNMDSQNASIAASSSAKSSANTSTIDGVYEFVSRTTTITAPKQSVERIAAPEWYGLWIFHEGYFSQTRMQNIRPDWTPAQFPSSPQGLGFDGSSGTYITKGDVIILKHMVNFYPGRIGAIEEVTFRFDKDTLTLAWDMHPSREFGSTGRRVTVLQRIKAATN